MHAGAGLGVGWAPNLVAGQCFAPEDHAALPARQAGNINTRTAVDALPRCTARCLAES